MSRTPALLIRADADRDCGTGHVMRSLALAEAFREAGGKVLFVGRCTIEPVEQIVEELGFRWIALEASHPDPEDLASTLRTAGALSEDASEIAWIVLDGYHFDLGYSAGIQSRGFRLAALDDIGTVRASPAQIVLNQNLSADRFRYELEPGAVVLRGPRWALVREGIRAARRLSPIRAGTHAQRLLVTLGGTDPAGVTLSIVRALRDRIPPDCQVRVVVGPGSALSPEVRAETAAAAGSWETHEAVRDMGSMFRWADLAITAGGGTVWELACHGVPSLVLAVAKNQEPGLEALSSAGFVISLGTLTDWDPARAASAVAALARDTVARNRMSEAAQAMVDGEGARRVAHVLLSFAHDDEPSLRSVEEPDAFLLWTWANDADTRRNSFRPEPIPWETHLAWFRRITSSSAARLYLLERSGIPMGVIRYERTAEEQARISFSVAAEFRGRGLGARLLALSAPRARKELGVRSLFGETFRHNEASRRAFLRAGFQETNGTDPERAVYLQKEPAVASGKTP